MQAVVRVGTANKKVSFKRHFGSVSRRGCMQMEMGVVGHGNLYTVCVSSTLQVFIDQQGRLLWNLDTYISQLYK